METNFKNKKFYAILILFAMIINMFSPYGVLVNTSYAARGADDPYLIFKLPDDIDPSGDYDDWNDATLDYYFEYDPDSDTPDTYSGAKLVRIQLLVGGNTDITGSDIFFQYDDSLLVPAQTTKASRNGTPYAEEATDWANSARYKQDSFAAGELGIEAVAELDASNCTVRYGGTRSPGADAYTNGDLIIEFLFMLKDGVSIEDLSTDAFTLSPTSGLSDGLQLVTEDGTTYDGADYLAYDGFASSDVVTVTAISLKTQPTKTKYNPSEALDFTGAVIEVSKSDGSKEEVTVSTAIAAGKLTVSSNAATVADKSTTLTYEGQSTDFYYYVLDSITIGTNPSKTSYEHGDTINYAGGKITATYTNSLLNPTSVTETIDIATGISNGTITANKNTADVNDKKVTLTYSGKNVNLPLTVTDPVVSISVSKQPTKQTYLTGDTLDFTGAEITPRHKSGITGTPIAVTNSSVTKSTTTADISSIPAANRWTVAGTGLQAGNQEITLTYQGFTAKMSVVVNDTVSSVSVVTQPTAKNKYETATADLDFTGLVVRVTTTGGATFDVGPNALTIDTSSYNPQSLSKQSFTVKYGTITAGNKAQLTLVNYITGIELVFEKTEFNYDTALSTVLNEGSYIEVYADGSKSTKKSISTGMVTGYVQKPASSLFDGNHQYKETLTVRLTSSSNSFDQLPAQATQQITINDFATGISVKYKPTKASYNYGDTFSSAGGVLNIDYKSGAQATLSMGSADVTLTDVSGNAISTLTPDKSTFVNNISTVTVKATYKTFDTTFTIAVKDLVDSIAITTDPTTEFEHGDTFTTGTGKLTLTYKSGRTEIVDLSSATIAQTSGNAVEMSPAASKYNSSNEYTEALEVTHSGKTVNYSIKLKNTIDNIAVTTNPKTSYLLNDSIDTSAGKITVTRKAGNTEEVSITSSMVTGLTTDTAGSRTATVTYTDGVETKTTTYNYEVVDNVSGVDVVAPTKTAYKHGDTLDLTGGKVTVHYASGTDSDVPMTVTMITDHATGAAVDMSPAISEFTSGNTITKTLDVEYTTGGKTGKAQYDITIENDVRSIVMKTLPSANDLIYNLGDTSYRLTGAEITVTRAVGPTQDISLPNNDVTLTDLSALSTTVGSKQVTVTYEGKTTNFNINIKNGVASIVITAPTKLNYVHGDTLDLSTGSIEVYYSDATHTPKTIDNSMVKKVDGSAVVMSPAVSDYDSNNEYTETLRITYVEDGVTKTEDFTITISNPIDSIAIKTSPTTSYNYGDSSTNVGGSIEVTRKAGNKEEVNITDAMVSGIDTSVPGRNQTATVTYTEGTVTKTTTYKFDVIDTVSSIAITAPTKEDYKHGESLDLTGGSILVTYASGATSPVTMTTAMIKESDGSTVNMSPDASAYVNYEISKTLVISYTENGVTETEDYEISLENNISSIALDPKPTKDVYNLNDTTYDLNGGKLRVNRAAGNYTLIPLTSNGIQLTQLSTLTSSTGNKTVSVSYQGKSTTFGIRVKDGVQSIAIVAPTKTTYEHGDTLDLTGGSINVTYSSSTLPVTMTTAMIKDKATGMAVDMSPAVTDYVNNQITRECEIEYTEDGVTEKVDYTFVIENVVTNIELNPAPSDTTYELFETTYKISDAKLKITRKAGNVIELPLSNSDITLTDLSTLTNTNGSKTVDVTYEGKTTTFGITVNDGVSSIELTKVPKSNYKLNEALESLSIKVTKASGTEETIPVTADMVSGFDSSIEGVNHVVITYGGRTVGFDAQVIDAITSIAMETLPKTFYLAGESLDVTGGKIRVSKESGAYEIIDLTADMVDGFNSVSVVENLQLDVTYAGKTTRYTIDVIEPVNSITVHAPTKTTYKYGEALNLDGGTIDIERDGGNTSLNITPAMVSGYNATPAANSLPSTQTITVKYGKNTLGQDVTDTFEVTVIDYVTGITVNNPKTSYKYNENLDDSVGTIIATMASGAPAMTVNLRSGTITGYDKTVLGSQTLTVEYDGQTTTYSVTVNDYITNETIVAPTKTTYNYGDSLDLSTGKIIESWASGAADTEKALDASMVAEADGSAVDMSPSTFDASQKVSKTLVITYNGNTENYPIEIINDVKSITIKDEPKKAYAQGAVIDTSVGSIEVTRADGTKETVAFTDSKVSFDGFDTSMEASNVPVTVKFTENGITKQTSYAINVTDNVVSITLQGTPVVNYKYGEALDLTGLTLDVERPSGTTTGVVVIPAMVSGYDPTQLGQQTVTITYGGKTQTYDVTVTDYMTGIELVKPTKLTYKINDTLDLTGASITEVYASGAKVTGKAITNSMVSGFDSTTEGTKTLTVTYTKDSQNYTANFDVVVADDLAGITVKAFPVNDYQYGDTLDLTGALIEVETESGAKEDIAITSAMVSGFNSTPSASDIVNNVSSQTLTITYTKDGITKTATFPVTVNDFFDHVKVDGLKDQYKYGEELDLTGATVSKVSAAGIVSDTISLTEAMISGYDKETVGAQTLTVSYSGKDANPVVTVVDSTKAISIETQPDKTKYKYGENLDTTGATIKVIKDSGEYIIDVTSGMISGYDPKKSGLQTVVVTYDGYTAEFAVEVEKKAESSQKPVKDPTDNGNEPTTPVDPGTDLPTNPVDPANNNNNNNNNNNGNKPSVENKEDNTAEVLSKVVPPVATAILATSFVLILAAALRRKNVEVYVEGDDEDVKLLGKERASKDDKEVLDLSDYVKNNPEKPLQIVFNKSISKKLDGKTVIVKLSDNDQREIKVKYEGEEFISEINK